MDQYDPKKSTWIYKKERISYSLLLENKFKIKALLEVFDGVWYLDADLFSWILFPNVDERFSQIDHKSKKVIWNWDHVDLLQMMPNADDARKSMKFYDSTELSGFVVCKF